MHQLPSFKRPPVTEVVIAARFKRANRFSLPALGGMAQQMAEAGFSKTEERPAYDAPVEEFGSLAEQNSLGLELQLGPPPILYRFLNDAGDELLQVQPNWFAANWRKVDPTAVYGRWNSRWDAFQRWLTVVAESVSDGELDFEQVEVTYVNHIESLGVWSDHGDAPEVFTTLVPIRSEFLGGPEQYSTDLKFVIRSTSDEEKCLGRLHVSIQPAFRRGANTPIFVMKLTARGPATGPGVEGVQGFADIAHEWIVRGFIDLTSETMHKAWDRLT